MFYFHDCAFSEQQRMIGRVSVCSGSQTTDKYLWIVRLGLFVNGTGSRPDNLFLQTIYSEFR